MTTVKIHVDMDESWLFWPVYEGCQQYRWSLPKTPTLEVPVALVEEYERASAAYFSIRDKMEALYRVQQGLPPHPNMIVPEHKIL